MNNDLVSQLEAIRDGKTTDLETVRGVFSRAVNVRDEASSTVRQLELLIPEAAFAFSFGKQVTVDSTSWIPQPQCHSSSLQDQVGS